MIRATIQLLVLVDPDDTSRRRLVRAPLTIRGTTVTVEDYKTGEEILAHVADLEKP